MRISDWSSDVCSSDLSGTDLLFEFGREWRLDDPLADLGAGRGQFADVFGVERAEAGGDELVQPRRLEKGAGARKSVVEGKSVSVRVARGGRHIIKKQTAARKPNDPFTKTNTQH